MEALPGPEVRDQENLRSYVRTNIRSYSHYAGTCTIGTDEQSVVDTSLHVHGINNVRVADASVMPSPISANTNATVYAIAERAAELIRSKGRTARTAPALSRTALGGWTAHRKKVASREPSDEP
jgi:choline dehydrogenase